MSDKLLQILDTPLSQPDGLLLQALAGIWGTNAGITYLGKMSIGLLFNVSFIDSTDSKRLVVLFDDEISYKILEASETLQLNTNVKAALVLANEV